MARRCWRDMGELLGGDLPGFATELFDHLSYVHGVPAGDSGTVTRLRALAWSAWASGSARRIWPSTPRPGYVSCHLQAGSSTALDTVGKPRSWRNDPEGLQGYCHREDYVEDSARYVRARRSRPGWLRNLRG